LSKLFLFEERFKIIIKKWQFQNKDTINQEETEGGEVSISRLQL
jgi:hypothetical protein